MKKIFFIALIGLLHFSQLFAQNDKDAVYNKLIEKFHNIKSLEIDFELKENPAYSGKITAKKGNKYIIEMENRKIVCNGSSIWNYSAKAKNVVINKFDPAKAGFSVEDLFFSILLAYEPVELVKESTSKGGSGLILKLVPPKKESEIDNVKSVSLWLDQGSYKIYTVAIDDGNGMQTWFIDRILLNEKVSDKIFEYTPPKGIEVIDMR